MTVALLLQSGSEGLSSVSTTGLLMLFSAGTFLYVATVHVLPEIVSGGGGGHSHGLPARPGPAASASSPGALPSSSVVDVHHSGFTCAELIALVTGALLPTCISLGHSH